jgi:O-antigen/teichoic acid export membrane protein
LNIRIFTKDFQMIADNSLRAQLIRGAIGSAGILMLDRIVGLLLVIVLARTLGTEGYGIYAYVLALMSMLILCGEAGVPIFLIREVSAKRELGEWGLLRGVLRRGIQLVALMALGMSALGILTLWAKANVFSLSMAYTLGVMFLLLPIMVLGKTITHAILGLNRIVLGQAINTLIRPLLVLIIVSSCFFMWPNLREPYYAMAAQLVGATTALIIGSLVLKYLLQSEVGNVEPIYRSRDWLKSALTFTLIGGAGVINSHADLIMLGWIASNKDVGIYNVAVQGSALVTFGLLAANTVLAPQFSKLYAQGDITRLQKLVTKSARVILLFALPVALLLICAGGTIVLWLFGSNYTDAESALAILAAGQLINAGFGSVGYLLSMTGHERISARILWQTALLNVVLNAVMIPLYGPVGAAFASAISLAIWNMLLYREVHRWLGISSTALRLKDA